MPGLKSKLLDTAAFNLLETVGMKFFGVVSFAILVRLLPRSDIGLIAIVAGYLAILTPLSLSPHTVLFRDYEKMKGSLNEHVSSYLAFWAWRSVAIMAISTALSIVLFYWTNNAVLSVYLVGASVVLNLNLLQGMIADVLYVSFHQRRITKITLYTNLLMLASMGLLFFYPNVLWYLAILIAWNTATAAWWWAELRKRVAFKFQLPKDYLRNIWKSFSELSFWNHLNTSMMELIYRADTVILALFVSATAVGNYAIALTIGNAFVLIPRIIQKSTTLGLSQMEDKEKESELVSTMLKNSALLAIAQLAGFYFVGRWVIGIFTPTQVEEIFFLTLLIGFGVSLLNVIRPLVSLNFSKTSVKKSFLEAYLPAAAASMAFYFVFTKFFGVTGTGLANIASYALLSLLIVAFTLKTYSLKWKWGWWSDREKSLLKEFFDKVKKKLSR